MTTYRELVIKKVEEPLRQRIVEEIESGAVSQCEAARTYGVSRTIVQRWVKQYGKLRTRVKIVEVVMKDEKEKIAQLQKALAEAHLKVRFYERIIHHADQEYKTDLKKNFGTKAFEISEENAGQSRKPAK